jgi:iron-sulfur cluster repair protein YtfE (RIC family)
METHTPIKRSKAFVQFSREHHFGLLQAWQIRHDLAIEVPAELISRYVLDFFEKDLRGHFKKEEDHLFGKLPAGDPLREQAEKEHKQLYALVDTILQNRSDKELLLQFAGLLSAHIRFEERILFNHLQEIMTEEALERLLLEMDAEDSSKVSCAPKK